MKKATTQQRALIDFLREFAGHMLSAGVSLEQFEDAARTAFIQAAMEHTRLGNSRINQSAIAAITGMSRPLVRKYLNAIENSSVGSAGRLSQVIDAWQKDPEYRGNASVPTKLPIRGRAGSFESLVRKYSGDVSYKALLAELQKLKYVNVARGYVTLTKNGLRHFEPRELRQITSGLAFALKSAPSDPSDLGVFTAEAIYSTPSPKARLLIKKRLMQSTRAFAADIKATGDAEAARTGATNERMSRASILVITMASKALNT